MSCTTFLDWISTALVWEPINVWLLLPQSRRLIAFPLPSHPIVSPWPLIRRDGWLTLDDDREFTHSRRRRIWHWTTTWLFLGDDLFASFYRLSLLFPSWGQFASRRQSIPDAMSRGGRMVYKNIGGWRTPLSHPGPMQVQLRVICSLGCTRFHELDKIEF